MPNPFDHDLIEHAERAWLAEVENADRIVKERHLALTLIVAFLGVGLFKTDWIQAVLNTRESFYAVAMPITGSLVLAIIALVGALFSLARRPASVSASSFLRLPEKAYNPPGGLTVDEQKRLVFARTYRFFQDLRSRNQKARERLSTSWTLLAVGISFAGLAVLIYIGGLAWTISRACCELYAFVAINARTIRQANARKWKPASVAGNRS